MNVHYHNIFKIKENALNQELIHKFYKSQAMEHCTIVKKDKTNQFVLIGKIGSKWKKQNTRRYVQVVNTYLWLKKEEGNI